MKTTVYLCRHGQCQGNRYRYNDGQYNSPLTGLGKRQAVALSRRFADEKIDAVYASDISRSYDTALVVAKDRGLEVQIHKGLREGNYGVWDHMLWADIEEKWPGYTYLYDHEMDKWMVPGAERLEHEIERNVAAIREIAAENEGKTVVIVGHGDAIRLSLGIFNGYSLDEIGHHSGYSTPGAVSKLEFEDGKATVVYEHDFSHLDDSTLQKTSPMWSRGFKYRILAPSEELSIEGWDKPLDRNVGTWIAGFRDGVPAALLQLLPTDIEHPGEVGFYYVAPAFRGQKVGIIALGQAVEIYRNCAVRKMIMHIPEEFAGFFEKFDFTHVKDDIWELEIEPVKEIDR